MLVRALKVLNQLPFARGQHGHRHGSPDQPGDEGWAYDRATTDWQRLTPRFLPDRASRQDYLLDWAGKAFPARNATDHPRVKLPCARRGHIAVANAARLPTYSGVTNRMRRAMNRNSRKQAKAIAISAQQAQSAATMQWLLAAAAVAAAIALLAA
jgi:hypothetical protein